MIHDLFLPLLPLRGNRHLPERESSFWRSSPPGWPSSRRWSPAIGPIETVAEEAREVVAVIGRLTGEIRADDVLDDIFSRFCIGK